jgi:hypothetical protein
MDGMNGKSAKISGPRPLPSTLFSLLHSTTRRFIVWTIEEVEGDYSGGQSSPWAVVPRGKKESRSSLSLTTPLGTMSRLRVNDPVSPLPTRLHDVVLKNKNAVTSTDVLILFRVPFSMGSDKFCCWRLNYYFSCLGSAPHKHSFSASWMEVIVKTSQNSERWQHPTLERYDAVSYFRGSSTPVLFTKYLTGVGVYSLLTENCKPNVHCS